MICLSSTRKIQKIHKTFFVIFYILDVDPNEYGSTYGKLYTISDGGLTATKTKTPNILTLCRTNQVISGHVKIRLKVLRTGTKHKFNHIGFATRDSGAYRKCGFNSDETAYVKIDTGEVTYNKPS